MATLHSPEWTAEDSRDEGDRGLATRLGDHFAKVSARYRNLRDLDLGAVGVISEVLARTADPGRAMRLLDVATGSGRYLDAISHSLASIFRLEVAPVGLDLCPAMLTQAHLRNSPAGPHAQQLVGTVEALPFQTNSCDVMTCFNAVHHVDLAQFAGEASRVLTSSGQLVIYTRTPEQNRRTVWGQYFPEFATRETRLHGVHEVQAALQATGAYTSVHVQPVTWTVTTSLARLVEQATHFHYSTFRLYPDDALRAAIGTFCQRVCHAFRNLTRITYDNDHLLVIAQRSVLPHGHHC